MERDRRLTGTLRGQSVRPLFPSHRRVENRTSGTRGVSRCRRATANERLLPFLPTRFSSFSSSSPHPTSLPSPPPFMRHSSPIHRSCILASSCHFTTDGTHRPRLFLDKLDLADREGPASLHLVASRLTASDSKTRRIVLYGRLDGRERERRRRKRAKQLVVFVASRFLFGWRSSSDGLIVLREAESWNNDGREH